MNRMRKYSLPSLYLIIVSFIGLFLLVFMVFWAPHLMNYSFQRTLILAIFVFICLSGMLATVYPSRCSNLFTLGGKVQDFRDERQMAPNSGNIKKLPLKSGKIIPSDVSVGNVSFEGHHPDCGEFDSHTFNLQGRRYCAGCSGLFIGALLAVIGTVIYYFYGNFSEYVGQISFWTGFLAVFVALFQNIFLDYNKFSDYNKNIYRFLSNLALVLGSFLILVGIDTVNSNLFTGIYFLTLTIFWILTRTAFSQEKHANICVKCTWRSSCSHGKTI